MNADEFENAADVLEAIVMRTVRIVCRTEPPAIEIRRAVEAAAPEFERLWEGGLAPTVALVTRNGRLAIDVSPPPSSDDLAPYQ